MSVERIILKIKEQADQKIQVIEQNCQKEIEEIRKETDFLASEKYDAIIKEAKRKAKDVMRSRVSLAQFEARALVRRAREEGIDHCFESAEPLLLEFKKSDEYVRILEQLMFKGWQDIGTGSVSVIAGKNSFEAAKKAAKSIETVTSVEVDTEGKNTFSGGVIVVSDSGNVKSNQTFSARLEREKEQLLQEVAEILYGEP